MQNEHLTQTVALAAQITPAAARAVGSYVSEAVDLAMFPRVAAALQIGTLAGAGTINLRFQHNTVSASSDVGWADVDSTNCITSTFTSTSNDKIARLELRGDQNPDLNRYVRAYVTVATSTWIGGVTVHGSPGLYEPASNYNSAAVAQTVVF